MTGNESVEPEGTYLTAAGCVRQETSDTGQVVLGFPDRQALRYDCAGVERSTWSRAYGMEVMANASRVAEATGTAIAMAGYWEYEVVEVTSTCTHYIGSIALTVPSAGYSDVMYGDAYLGNFWFDGGIPRRFDIYADFPCNELVVSAGNWVDYEQGGGGGDGGSGGSGGGGSPPPPPPPPEEEPISMDGASSWELMNLPMTPPDCSPQSQAVSRQINAFCNGSPLSYTQIGTVQAALQRILSRGGVCEDVFNVATATIDKTTTHVRIFDHRNYRLGGTAPIGAGLNGWIIISDEFLNTYNNPSKRRKVYDSAEEVIYHLSLDDIIVHETDHLRGWEHPWEDAVSSESMPQCGSDGAM